MTYRAELEAQGLRGSMGRRGNPYDNAKAESWKKGGGGLSDEV